MDGEEHHSDDADELDEDDLSQDDAEADAGEELDGEREETGESVTIEISGLSLYTHHGVSEAEREVGQRLVLDLRLDLGESDATVEQTRCRTPSTTARSASWLR